MKRIVCSLAVVSMAVSAQAASPSTSNNDFFFKPYVGADYDQVHVNYKDDSDSVLNDNINGGDIHVGARVHQNLGFELGYLDSTKSSKDNLLGSGLNSNVKVNGETVDALGYLPIGAPHTLELIGTAGVSRLEASSSYTGALSSLGSSKTEVKGRVGAGAQYWLTDNLNARAIVRYQGADFGDVADNAIVSSVGLNWQF